MTDLIFASLSGTIRVVLRTDLLPANINKGVGALTVLNVRDFDNTLGSAEGVMFAQVAKVGPTTLNDLIAFANTNDLTLVAQPTSGGPGTSTTLSAQLAAPTGFLGTVNGATQITLNWTKSPGATGYVLQRSTSVDFSTALTTFTLGDVAVKVDTGLVTGTHYWYRLKATSASAADSDYALDNKTTS